MAAMAARPPRASFAHQKTVRLVVDDGMEVDALSIVRSLPDFQAEIVGVVPQFGGKCFDITLGSVESATQLATIGFDYVNEVKPLRLLGARSIHVSIFVSVEFPDKELTSFLKQYGQLKTDTLRRLYYNDEGFAHIERGIRVAEFVALDKDLPRKIVTQGLEIFFKYSGQPVSCYRCGSTEHMVKECPRQRRARPQAPREPESGGGPEVSSHPPSTSDSTSMDTEPTPSSADTEQPASDTPSQPSSAVSSPPATYAAVTQELFSAPPSVENSRKRAPPSPAKDDKPAAKKATSSTTSTSPTSTDNPYLSSFLRAITKSGPSRVRLMGKISGDVFYHWRALHFQHTYGNLAELDPRAPILRQLNEPEKEHWGKLAGSVRQDAFADLLSHCERLRKGHPLLFT